MLVTLIQSAIRFSTIFLFGATGETLVEKSGQLNLGIPGIMCMGLVGGGIGANICQTTMTNPSTFVVLLVSIFFSFMLAGLTGALFGFFTITLKCNQNVTGLVITTFGSGVMSFWGGSLGKQGITFYQISKHFVDLFPNHDKLGTFGELFFSYGPLVYLAIIIAILLAIFLNKTRTGLHLRAVGENPAAADAAGISVTNYRYAASILGAGIAGLGGLFYLLDQMRGSIEYTTEQMGWIAVALVIFSVWKPARGILGSIIFGLLYILPNYYTFGIPRDIFKMIPYVVTIIVLIIISIRDKKESQPPVGLGLAYFREER